MSKDKWVKLFITTETQTVLMIVPTTTGVQIEASVMIDGKIRSSMIYTGTDMETAQEKFEGFTREQAVSFVSHVMGNPEDVVVVNE